MICFDANNAYYNCQPRHVTSNQLRRLPDGAGSPRVCVGGGCGLPGSTLTHRRLIGAPSRSSRNSPKGTKSGIFLPLLSLSSPSSSLINQSLIPISLSLSLFRRHFLASCPPSLLARFPSFGFQKINSKNRALKIVCIKVRLNVEQRKY